MSYLALARKWRPRTFTEVVGQEHVTTPIRNALTQGRLHHAYLFTGTRGVGKTSLGRLLAKALNCEQNVAAEPCLSCSACLAIEQGTFIDLIEVDGASRTRVEDTRDLLENVLYLPTSGRFKIYLIDEVHMLSQHSFNALLKTLEEPPEYVKFILATTEPHKLPATILSRCLQFHLRHLPQDRIQAQLIHILEQEGSFFDPAATALIATAAKGSMRDALSLLEQAIANASDDNRKVSVGAVKNMLGYTDHDYALQLLEALAGSSPVDLLTISHQIANTGGYFQYVLDELLHYLHRIMITQHLTPHVQKQADLAHHIATSLDDTGIQALSKQFSLEDVQLFYQIGLKGAEEMQLAPTPSLGFEMMLLRMLTFKPMEPKAIRIEPSLSSTQKPPEPPPESNVRHANAVPNVNHVKSHVHNVEKPVPQEKPQPSEKASSDEWHLLLPRLNLQGFASLAAQNSEFVTKSGAEITLRTARGHYSLFTPHVVETMESALSAHYQEKIKLKIIQVDKPLEASPAEQQQRRQAEEAISAKQSLEKDPFCQQLQKTFSAELNQPEMLPNESV